MQRRLLTVKASFEDAMGGSVVAALNRSQTARLNGWEATVATTTDGEESLTLLRDSELPHELFRRRFPRSLASSPAMLLWLMRKAGSYDLIEVHEIFTFPTLYARIAASYRKVPLAIHPNNSLDPYDLRKHEFIKRRLRFLYRWLLQGTQALWTASALEAERVDTFGVTLPKYVSPLPVGAGPAVKKDGQTNEPYVLFLGRLDPKKGLERLIQATGLLQRGGAPHLVIAGSGDTEYASVLAALADRELAPASFRFTGHVSGAIRDRLLSDASVFVLHSDNENFGIAVIEALGHGLPVILSPEVYIASDLQAQGVCTVVPVDDVNGLASAISERMRLDMPARRQVAMKARAVARQYEFEACAERDDRIRREILSQFRGVL